MSETYRPAGRLFELARLLDDQVSDRKRRRFAVACLARYVARLEDPRSRRAFEVARRHAVGLATEEELSQVMSHAFDAHIEMCETRFGGDGPVTWTYPGDMLCRAAAMAVTHGLYYAEDVADFVRRALVDEAGAEEAVQVALLEEILGPLPPPAFDPIWRVANDSAVAHLARCVEAEQDFGLMPLLADALEDAGCADAAILNHCRQPGSHVPGCWVIDAILSDP